MPTPILTTKLYIPPSRPNLVHRRRLIRRLNEGLHRILTLVSAPAGFGKTTLVGDWVAGCERLVAWLSLDEEESAPVRYLTYLVAALQTIVPDAGTRALGMFQPPQPLPLDDERRWHHYHHLSADLLQQHLQQNGAGAWASAGRVGFCGTD